MARVPESLTTQDVWDRFRDPLKRYLLKRLNNEDDAEDVLQEVLCRIQASLSGLRDQAKLSSWVYRITRNALFDCYRGRNVAMNHTPLPENIAAEEPFEGDWPEGLGTCLHVMINQLPKRYRDPVWFTYMDALPQKDLGRRLGISYSGVKSRLQRGRDKLKTMLLDCCHFERDRFGHVYDYHPKHDVCQECSPPFSPHLNQ